MAYIDKTGENHVVIGGVGIVGADIFAHLPGVQLSVVLRQCQHLVAGKFNCAALVGVDMSGHCGYGAFVGLQKGVDGDLIGLGAAIEEENLRFGTGAGSANLILRGGTEIVPTVAGGLYVVCVHKACHDLFMGTGGIVVEK